MYTLFHYQQRRSVCKSNLFGQIFVNPFHSLPFFPVYLSPLFTSPQRGSEERLRPTESERFELPQRVWAGGGAFSTENHAFGEKIDLFTLICVKTVLNLHCTHCFTRINDNLVCPTIVGHALEGLVKSLCDNGRTPRHLRIAALCSLH